LLTNLLLALPVYLKVTYNILKTKQIGSIIKLVPIWITFGMIIILYWTLSDIMTLIKLLCNYHIDEDMQKVKEMQEFEQDKIVIYNEVIDVMKSVISLYQMRRSEHIPLTL
jgi:hypothetical protein